MNELNLEWKTVTLEELKMDTQTDEADPAVTCYADGLYIMQALKAFTLDTVRLLLEIHPIVVLKIKPYSVIAGARIFRIAAAFLPPSEKIRIGFLDKKTTKEQLDRIKYLDLAISPLLLARKSKAAAVYQSINIPGLRVQTFKTRYNFSLKAFASIIGIKPRALCWSAKQKLDKSLTIQTVTKTNVNE
jgi:hypothetical protein